MFKLNLPLLFKMKVSQAIALEILYNSIKKSLRWTY